MLDPVKLRSYVVHVPPGTSGDLAWREAIRRADHPGAKLVAVRAISPVPGKSSWRWPRTRRAAPRIAELRSSAVAELAARAEAVPGAVDVEIVIVDDDPATEIVRAANEHGAELIIFGDDATDEVPTARLASSAIQYARCAVLIVRDRCDSDVVVGGTDFSDVTLPVVTTTCREAVSRSRGRAIVVHSVEEGHVVTRSTQTLQSLTTDIVREAVLVAGIRLRCALREHPLAEPMITNGPAGAALVSAASQADADLLVVGTAGRTGLSRFMLGNVAEYAMRYAPCSVLAVRLCRSVPAH
jgi:nucleotide-binding universal stress UspA family protein